jgi:hypothetical protein
MTPCQASAIQALLRLLAVDQARGLDREMAQAHLDEHLLNR